MAADVVQRHAGRELGVAVMEDDLARIHLANHRADILHIIGGLHHLMAHAPPGGVFHLLLLEVEARIGEVRERAGMVVVEMRDHHIANRAGVDADQRQALPRQAL